MFAKNSRRVVVAIALMLATAASFADRKDVAADLPVVNVNNGFAELVKAVKPAVVNISTTVLSPQRRAPNRQMQQMPQLDEFFERFFGEQPEHFRPFQHRRNQDRRQATPRERRSTAVGSGFIIDPQGLVVTNHHVIDGADEIEVVFDDGSRYPAELKGHDAKTDLALLQINVKETLPFVRFGDSDAARVGDWVIAIGNPFGLGGTTTSGIISARGRDIQSGPLDDFIQIDASINRGNSGGPLFNTQGEVIGVNSAIYSPNGGNIGIGFAIPASMAENVVSQLRDTGIVQRGFLGVQVQTVTDEIAESLNLNKARGALVVEVTDDSPASRAGIEAGDVILRYDGKRVEKMRDLPKLVAVTKKESKVNLVVWRNGKRKTLRVTVGSNEEEIANARATTAPDSLGLSLAKLNDENRAQYNLPTDADGVVVTDVDENGGAFGKIQTGDVIKRIGSTRIPTAKKARSAIASAREAGKKSLLLLVERAQQTRFVVVSLEAKS